MIKKNTENNKDEILLHELLATMWAYKFFICSITIFFIILSCLYIIRAEKIYVSKSIFAVTFEENSSSISSTLANQLGSLSSIAGLAKGSSTEIETLIERISAREFTLEVMEELNLRNDKFLNSYDDTQSSGWKTRIKFLLGIGQENINPDKIEKWIILENFKKFVDISETDGGSIQVKVKHNSAKKAEIIANYIAKKTISLVQKEKISYATERLNYLSSVLANSLINLENSEEKLKEFTLYNSAQARTSFAQGSILLDELRSKKEQSKSQLNAIDAIKRVITNSSPTPQEYLRLRKEFPLLDQSTFRRILGISESISSWSWPTLKTLTRVEASVRDREASLEIEIGALEAEANRYAESAVKLAELERELKIAGTTYKLLLEQVKGESLVSGFTPNRAKFIARADAAIAATEPKVILILTLSGVIGLFSGAAFALALHYQKGVYSSLRTILSSVELQFQHNTRSLRNFQKHSLLELQNRLFKKPEQWPRHVFLEVANSQENTALVIVDTTNLNYADTITRMLGVSAGELGCATAIVNLSRKILDHERSEITKEAEILKISDRAKECDEYIYPIGTQNIQWLFDKGFARSLDLLRQKYQLVLLSANSDCAEYIRSAELLSGLDHMLYIQKGRTKKSLLENVSQGCRTKVILHG